jgi:hypothetical protein
MSGFSTRAREAVASVTPGWADASISERGLSAFLDPSMTGRRRFCQPVGNPFGLLTPQLGTVLALAATAGSTEVLLSGTHLLPWLVPGSTIRIEGLEELRVLAIANTTGNTLLTTGTILQSSHSTGVDVRISSFPVLVADEILSGAAAPTREAVRVTSPFLLLPGDIITIPSFGEVTLSQVEEVATDTYDVHVTSLSGFPDILQGTPLDVKALPAYLSDLLTLPSHHEGSFVRGPVAVDFVSGRMTTSSSPSSIETKLLIEEVDTANRVILPLRESRINSVLSRQAISADQILFWQCLEGTLDWNGTKTLLRGQGNGRCHVWTPVRPQMAAGAVVQRKTTVPTFAPYRLLLNNDILPTVVVRLVSGAVVPTSQYTVNTTNGNVDFVSAMAGTPVIVDFAPRSTWLTTVTPSEDGLELTIVVGRAAKVVIPLGAAGVPQPVKIAAQDENNIDQIHIAVRRASGENGPFVCEVGDLIPATRSTAAVRYAVVTTADYDYDWACSGLLVKPLWPNIDLLRARLDGDTIGGHLNYLDNGRFLF